MYARTPGGSELVAPILSVANQPDFKRRPGRNERPSSAFFQDPSDLDAPEVYSADLRENSFLKPARTCATGWPGGPG